MEFDFTEEQRILRDLCQKIAGDFPEEYWAGIEDEERFPREFWDVVTEQGLLGISLPEEYGGSGMGMLDLCVASEALGEAGACEGSMIFVGGPVFGGCAVMSGGSEEQKQNYIPKLIGGELWSGAFTEPDAGSNVSQIRLEAKRHGDVYRIKGQKVFISNVANADRIVILARTSPYDPKNRTAGVSLLVGDLPSDKIEARPFKKMGSKFMDTNAVFFDDFEVPVENLLGGEGGAWKALYGVLNPERFVIAAGCIGTGNYLIKKAVEYAGERSVWGKPIATHQGLQFPLAEARIQLECARLKVYEAAWLFDKGEDAGVATVMAKHAACHAALFAADRAIQTLGGAGYIAESGVERIYRNLRGTRMVPISDEMVLNTIAQHDLGMPRSY